MGPTHYDVLRIERSATPAEIKASYRQILLKSHPDKQPTVSSGKLGDISALQEAYRVLSNSDLREAYDASIAQEESNLSVPHSRPAHVVSLEDFEPQLLDNPSKDSIASWSYPCRCGNLFVFTEEDLDNESHIVGCSSCSETLYVGYEITEDENYDATSPGVLEEDQRVEDGQC